MTTQCTTPPAPTTGASGSFSSPGNGYVVMTLTPAFTSTCTVAQGVIGLTTMTNSPARYVRFDVNAPQGTPATSAQDIVFCWQSSTTNPQCVGNSSGSLWSGSNVLPTSTAGAVWMSIYGNTLSVGVGSSPTSGLLATYTDTTGYLATVNGYTVSNLFDMAISNISSGLAWSNNTPVSAANNSAVVFSYPSGSTYAVLAFYDSNRNFLGSAGTSDGRTFAWAQSPSYTGSGSTTSAGSGSATITGTLASPSYIALLSSGVITMGNTPAANPGGTLASVQQLATTPAPVPWATQAAYVTSVSVPYSTTPVTGSALTISVSRLPASSTRTNRTILWIVLSILGAIVVVSVIDLLWLTYGSHHAPTESLAQQHWAAQQLWEAGSETTKPAFTTSPATTTSGTIAQVKRALPATAGPNTSVLVAGAGPAPNAAAGSVTGLAIGPTGNVVLTPPGGTTPATNLLTAPVV